MLKQILPVLISIIIASSPVFSADSVSVSFTSKQIEGKYSPDRDVIVYVLDNIGSFIRTIAYWGRDRRDCRTWMTISGNNVVDAVSAATIRTSSSNLNSGWNGISASGQSISAGTYWLCIEGTADDNDASAPRIKCKMEIDGTSKTLTTVDSSLNNGSSYFTNLSLQIFGDQTDIIKSRDLSRNSSLKMFAVGHKVKIPFSRSGIVKLMVMDLNGTVVAKSTLDSKDSRVVDFSRFRLRNGIYLIKAESGSALFYNYIR